MNYQRYAIFYVPPADEDWAEFATGWLGWDMQAGRDMRQPDLPGLPLSDITRAPRKYGLHATLKPPFRLSTGVQRGDLEAACAALAQTHPPVETGPLHLARMGPFLALCPEPSADLSQLAATCVHRLDHLRAALTDGDMAQRRKSRLTPRQDDNLLAWGYPYVLDDFRFHITLTGPMSGPDLQATQKVLEQRLVPLLPRSLRILDLALCGEDEQGRFHLLQRFALTGAG